MSDIGDSPPHPCVSAQTQFCLYCRTVGYKSATVGSNLPPVSVIHPYVICYCNGALAQGQSVRYTLVCGKHMRFLVRCFKNCSIFYTYWICIHLLYLVNSINYNGSYHDWHVWSFLWPRQLWSAGYTLACGKGARFLTKCFQNCSIFYTYWICAHLVYLVNSINYYTSYHDWQMHDHSCGHINFNLLDIHWPVANIWDSWQDVSRPITFFIPVEFESEFQPWCHSRLAGILGEVYQL